MIAVALLAALHAADVGRVVDRVAPRVMAERHIPGAAIVVVQDDRVVFAKGEGDAFLDVSHRLHLGASTFLPVGHGAWRASRAGARGGGIPRGAVALQSGGVAVVIYHW